MRILPGPTLGVRDSDQAQDLDRPVERGLRLNFLVKPHRFGDLISAGVDRVQGRHRFLEDHRDVIATHVPHLLFSQPDQVPVAKPDMAGRDPAIFLQQPHDRQRRDALPRAGLPHQADRGLGGDGEIDAVDRLDSAPVNVKLGMEVFYSKEFIHL